MRNFRVFRYRLRRIGSRSRADTPFAVSRTVTLSWTFCPEAPASRADRATIWKMAAVFRRLATLRAELLRRLPDSVSPGQARTISGLHSAGVPLSAGAGDSDF